MEPHERAVRSERRQPGRKSPTPAVIAALAGCRRTGRARSPTCRTSRAASPSPASAAFARLRTQCRRTTSGPRFGLAYQLNERIVLRGGFGLYYSNPEQRFAEDQRLQHQHQHQQLATIAAARLIPNLLTNPFPNGINQPTGSSLGAATFVGQNPTWFDPNFVTPKVCRSRSASRFRPPRAPPWKSPTWAAAATT